jgi:hypothetical protein
MNRMENCKEEIILGLLQKEAMTGVNHIFHFLNAIIGEKKIVILNSDAILNSDGERPRSFRFLSSIACFFLLSDPN